jgi:transcriptional regulator with XRE-family HTH domain
MKRDWPALFDELKRAGQFSSDAQLAEHLGVTRSQISAWRKGKSDLGSLTKLRILDALGHDDLQSALASLLSDTDPIDGLQRHRDLKAKIGDPAASRKRKV